MEVDSVEVDLNRDPDEDESVFWKKPAHLSSREEQEFAKVVKPITHSLLDLLGTQHVHKLASFEDRAYRYRLKMEASQSSNLTTLGKHNLDSPLEDINSAQKLVKQSKTSMIAEEKLYEHGLSPFPTCEPKNKIVMVNMCSGSKSIGTSAKCLVVKRSQVDADDLSSHPPKISKASSCNWASAMNMLFKVNEPSSSLITETCSTTVPTPISTKFLSAQDAQFVSPLGSPKMPSQSVNSDQQTHKTENFSIAVFDKSCGDSGKDVRDVKAIPKILDGARKCVSPASMAIEEESDLVQISKSIGDKMTQMAYLALEEERKMQNTLAAEVSRLKEVNENLLSRIDNRISENLQLEKLLKQERERSVLELDTQKEKFKAEIIKCKTEFVKSNVTNGKLRKKCDALKAELDEFVKRENLKQERERVMSLEKELESQKEKYRVDISEYQSQLVNTKKRAAQLLKRATYLEAEIPNREAAAVLAFKTSSDYHKTMEAVFKKAYEDCRAVLKEYCPELDFMIIHDEEDCDQNSAEKDAQGKEVSIRTEDEDLSNTDGPTTA